MVDVNTPATTILVATHVNATADILWEMMENPAHVRIQIPNNIIDDYISF